VPDAGWRQQERDAALLDHLERRRNAHDQVMWQAPALTIAGQAFLLQVLANEGLECVARAFVLAAGIAATWAAAIAIFHLRKREVQYSKRITALTERIEIDDPKPQEFAWPFPIIYWWVIALGAFGFADAAVFVAAM
jgi:hypothetical protein